MVAEQTIELTEDEAELYDRQIRLWGLDSQKRLRSSKVLLIGIKGFGAEVAKNIILSGVKSVTLLDNGILSEEDACSQFLAPRDAIGKSRAEASLARAQALNPMVQVIADTSKIEDKSDDFFLSFDVVVATECPVSELKRINTSCRVQNIKFFCGDVFGMFGYMFADLQIHEFAEDITKLSNEKPDPNKKRPEPVKITVKRSETFIPLVDALAIDWLLPQNQKKAAKMDYSYFLMRVLLEFRDQNKRDPNPSSRDADIEKLKEIRDTLLTSLNIPKDKIPDIAFGSVFAEVSPVCAIVGGVLSQEIVKAVSQKESPHNNFFFFNPEKCCGFVETHTNSD